MKRTGKDDLGLPVVGASRVIELGRARRLRIPGWLGTRGLGARTRRRRRRHVEGGRNETVGGSMVDSGVLCGCSGVVGRVTWTF